MIVEESFHWRMKKKFRQDIENYMIEHVIRRPDRLMKDRQHKNALNAIAGIPQNGRTLKVVFRRTGAEKVKLITAYYLD